MKNAIIFYVALELCACGTQYEYGWAWMGAIEVLLNLTFCEKNSRVAHYNQQPLVFLRPEKNSK